MRRFLTQTFERLGLRRAAHWDGGPGAAVVAVDAEGRVAALSGEAGALSERAAAEILGAPFLALFAEADRASVAAALGEGAGRLAAALRRADGGLTPVELCFRRRDNGENTVLILDAPGRSTGEKLSAAARAMRAEARERADLLADLSHEMKTPLNAVIGFAEAMAGETFGPLGHKKYAEYADYIRASGGHLLDLVTSILDLARIESDRFTLHPEMIDLGRLAEECAGIVRLAAERAGLKLTTRIAADIPESWLDPRAMRQIVINLLSNAVKFTSDGEILLSVDRAGEHIVLTVTDTGVGMSQTQIASLGARFTEAQGDGVRGVKGSGLGLALAFALAELHDGSLDIDSAPGEGVTATLRLPVRRPERPRRLHAVKTDHAGASGAPPQVLTQLERIEAYRRERQASAA